MPSPKTGAAASMPAFPLSPFGTLSHVGPMTRTVTDAAVLSVLWTLNVDFVQGDFLQPPERELSYDFSSM